MLDRQCFVEVFFYFCLVPNAPRHRAERAHAEADHDVKTALYNFCYPEAGHRAGPWGPANA